MGEYLGIGTGAATALIKTGARLRPILGNMI
jgi:hypothetical protein